MHEMRIDVVLYYVFDGQAIKDEASFSDQRHQIEHLYMASNIAWSGSVLYVQSLISYDVEVQDYSFPLDH